MSNVLLETIFDNLQEVRTQQLFNSAVVQELVENISLEFDRIDIELEAIKKQLLSDDPNTAENYDKLIKQEQVNSLKRRLLISTRKLMYLLEKKSSLGIEAEYSLIYQIEQTEIEVGELRLKIEEIGRGHT